MTNSTPLLESEVPVRVIDGPRAAGLASGAFWTLTASIAGAVSQWLLVAMTAKLGSTEMVGHLAMSLAIVAPVQALTDLALRPALATDARGDFRFRDYWRLRGAMIVLFLVIVGSLSFWRGGIAGPIILVIGLQKAVESASDIFFGLFQRAERLRWMGQSVVLRSALASLTFAAVMTLTGNLLWACLAGWIVRVAVFLLHDLTLFSSLSHGMTETHPHPSKVSGLLTASAPLAFAAFLMAVTVNVPRYIVERRMGAASLGIFAALIYLFQLGAILVDALGQAACVRLSRHHASGDNKAFLTLVMKLVGLAAAVSGCGVVLVLMCGEPLLSLAYSAAFAAHVRTLLWLSLCALPWYCSSVLGYAIVARRQMKVLLCCQITALLTALGASWWLIGGTDLSGACSAVFVIYSIQLTMYVFILFRAPERSWAPYR